VALEELHLILGEQERVVARVRLEPHQPLVAGLDVVAKPDAAHARRGNAHARQPQLVGHALGAVGGLGQGVAEDLLLDLGRLLLGESYWKEYGVRRPSAILDSPEGARVG